MTPWTVACQASLSITNSWSLLKLMSIKSVGDDILTSNHLIICCPLPLPHSVFPSIRVFSNELALHLRWPKYWSFSFSISPSNEYSGLISFRIDNIGNFPSSLGFSSLSLMEYRKKNLFSKQGGLRRTYERNLSLLRSC